VAELQTASCFKSNLKLHTRTQNIYHHTAAFTDHSAIFCVFHPLSFLVPLFANFLYGPAGQLSIFECKLNFLLSYHQQFAMKALKSLAIFNSVRLVWVPGHCGIEGNERVDLLAKQASSSCFTGPEPSVGISTSTVRSSISSQATQEQSRLWQALPKCRQAKLFLNTPDKGLAHLALSLEKKDLRILVVEDSRRITYRSCRS